MRITAYFLVNGSCVFLASRRDWLQAVACRPVLACELARLPVVLPGVLAWPEGPPPMSVFHLHTRLHEGAVGDPGARYLFESRDSDDLGEITTAAKDLAAGGFTVVVYDHGHRAALPGASDFRQVAKFWPDGRVEP